MLDRLDFALKRQLNRERNVRFVLESRPQGLFSKPDL